MLPFLCCKHLPLRVRRLGFIGIVYNALIAALEALVLTDAEHDRLTSFLCRRARALVLGRAHVESEGKHTTMNNVAVLKWVKLLPVHLELVVRRMKWFQAIVRSPDSAGSMLAAWFGKLPCDKKHNQKDP